MLDQDFTNSIQERARNAPEPIKKALRERWHARVVADASASLVLDDEARASLEFEVLVTLLGMQTVHDFEDVMEHHTVLSQEQGKKFASEVRKNLFAELALYLPDMDADESGSSRETIETCIARDAEVSARLAKLPVSVQAVIRSVALEDAFASLQRRHAIDPDVVTHVGGQMVRVMVGLTSINDFKVQVARIMGIPPGDIDALCLDVEQNLFRPVRTAILHALESVSDVSSAPEQKIADPYQAPSV